MGRYNTKNSRMDDPTKSITRLAISAVVVGGSVMLGWLFIDNNSKQITKEIDALETTYEKLSDDRRRENELWETKLIPENLKDILKRHGLLMAHPNPRNQVVYTDETGRIIPGQTSVGHIIMALDKTGARVSTH